MSFLPTPSKLWKMLGILNVQNKNDWCNIYIAIHIDCKHFIVYIDFQIIKIIIQPKTNFNTKYTAQSILCKRWTQQVDVLFRVLFIRKKRIVLDKIKENVMLDEIIRCCSLQIHPKGQTEQNPLLGNSLPLLRHYQREMSRKMGRKQLGFAAWTSCTLVTFGSISAKNTTLQYTLFATHDTSWYVPVPLSTLSNTEETMFCGFRKHLKCDETAEGTCLYTN